MSEIMRLLQMYYHNPLYYKSMYIIFQNFEPFIFQVEITSCQLRIACVDTIFV